MENIEVLFNQFDFEDVKIERKLSPETEKLYADILVLIRYNTAKIKSDLEKVVNNYRLDGDELITCIKSHQAALYTTNKPLIDKLMEIGSTSIPSIVITESQFNDIVEKYNGSVE